jgi:hypothetical protein
MPPRGGNRHVGPNALEPPTRLAHELEIAVNLLQHRIDYQRLAAVADASR